MDPATKKTEGNEAMIARARRGVEFTMFRALLEGAKVREEIEEEKDRRERDRSATGGGIEYAFRDRRSGFAHPSIPTVSERSREMEKCAVFLPANVMRV